MRWRHGLPRQVAEALEAAGHSVSVIETEGPGTAGRLARRRIEEGADLILALGGDGTLNELLPGVAHTEVPLGVIPGGTANVLSRELGLGANAIKAARRLGECVPVRVPVGVLRCQPNAEPRYFLLMAGVGFDAHIVYRLNLPLKAKAGQVAYWIGSLREFVRRLDEFQVEANGETFTCSFALASRVRNYAGYLQIARRVSLPKAEFETVLFEGSSALRYYLKYLAAVLTGRTANVKGMSFLRAQSVRFSAPGESRVYVQVDGEYAGRLPATIELEQGALTLLVPPEYAARG
jgi:YegS/Rv2252/BmrU family lipid kinase